MKVRTENGATIIEGVLDVEVLLNPVSEEAGLVVRLPDGTVILEVRQDGYLSVEDLRVEEED